MYLCFVNAALQNLSSDQFINLIVEKDKSITEKENQIIKLEERIAWFERQFFGKKSEKIQINLEE